MAIRGLSTSLSQMTPRERALLGAMGATFFGMAILLIGYFVWSGLDTLAERNDAMTQALEDLRTRGDTFRELERDRQSLERQMRAPPSLSGHLEEAATHAGIAIPESTERPTVVRGDIQEHTVDVKLRGVGLAALVKFLEKVESGTYLVLTSQLSVRTRFGEKDAFDVDVAFTTYEKATKSAREAAARTPATSPPRETP
jgi:type II secretory pathway component PulM